jgi:hypothetical protein
VLDIDTSGNLYVVWSTGANVFLRTSQDRGDTWSQTVQVSPPALAGTNIMPWIAAGDPGRVDIVWYRTAGANNAGSVWDIYMAQSLNVLSASPSFTVNRVSETVIHRGEICTAGLNCDIDSLAGTPRDRSFLEFPSIDIDSRGMAAITFNDNTNQADGPGKAGGAYVMVTRQTGGPSLYQSIGSSGLDPGTVTITQPAEGAAVTDTTVALAGSHTLPPDDARTDEAGDAKFPDHGAVIGPSIPALDLRKVSVADDGSSLTVTLELGDLTLPALATAAAQAGGDGVLYLTQWDFNDKVYWVAAEVRGGQPVFYTGTLGMIKSATSKKFITYNPDLTLSRQLQGSITNAAPGQITIRIPRSIAGTPPDGASLFTVTAYALSERGPLLPVGDLGGQPDPSSLPLLVDATGPFTYAVSNGTALDGVVEVSLDDASFASPTLASAGADGTWSATASQLATGAHTAYARQHVNGRQPSAAALVHFTVQVNRPPVAAGDSYSLVQDTVLDVAQPGVLGNDTDPDGDPLLASLVAAPQHGQLTLRADGSFTYTPTPAYTGADGFTYAASDGEASSDAASVALTVTPAVQTTGKANGGGEIAVPGGVGSFGFSVKRTSAGGPISGSLDYSSSVRNFTVQSTAITSFSVSGNTVRFAGNCTKNGTPCTFAVTAQDNGNPGKNKDRFDIVVSGEPGEAGVLTKGNVKVN